MHDFKHVSRYVVGACELDPSAPLDVEERALYARRLSVKVWNYLSGHTRLDSSFSSFERGLTLDAAAIFGWPEYDRARRSFFGDLPPR